LCNKKKKWKFIFRKYFNLHQHNIASITIHQWMEWIANTIDIYHSVYCIKWTPKYIILPTTKKFFYFFYFSLLARNACLTKKRYNAHLLSTFAQPSIQHNSTTNGSTNKTSLLNQHSTIQLFTTIMSIFIIQCFSLLNNLLNYQHWSITQPYVCYFIIIWNAIQLNDLSIHYKTFLLTNNPSKCLTK
jgi:hypothetical protein